MSERNICAEVAGELRQRLEQAERRVAEAEAAAESFREAKANLDIALRYAWRQRDDAERRAAELAETLAASEEWRKAYQKGKHALYAMGGDVQQAAMAHLPCNEGGLDSRFTSLLEMPRLLAKDEQIAALTLRAEAAEADLQRYADLFEQRGTQNAALARDLELTEQSYQKAEVEHARLSAEKANFARELAAARDVIEKHARHRTSCPCHKRWHPVRCACDLCTCGLAAALAAAPQEER